MGNKIFFQRRSGENILFSWWKVPMEVFLFTSGLTFWKENAVFLFFLWKAAAQTVPSTPVLYLTLVLREDLKKTTPDPQACNFSCNL